MDRASIYFMNETDENTYDFDEKLPPLPLPKLSDTLERYYESVKPFGNTAQLAQTRTVLDKFKSGIGAELQAVLEKRATNMKNWLGSWWEDYAYHMVRLPLLPYQLMAMAAQIEVVGVPETPDMALKNLARQTYHSLEFWDLLRTAKIKPLSSGGGKIKYSSALYKHFYSTTRVPGVERDHIEKHFRIKSEGPTPTHIVVSGKGRQFVFNGVHEDDTILTPQELLIAFLRIRNTLDYNPNGDCVSLLTHDERTAWANNRTHLLEISAENKESLKLLENSVVYICFDEHEPIDYEEVSQLSIYGDYHSRWADRSSVIIAYKNGKFAWTGEHSCYDGTVSVSFAVFIQLSFFECEEPDWNQMDNAKVVPLKEIKFELDERLRADIKRMHEELEDRGLDVTVTFTVFDEYGKEFLKEEKLHPDSFVQVIMQWAYFELHEDIAPTYETALMRHYYNGRTETLRSCTPKVFAFLKAVNSTASTKSDILKAFRAAVEDHRFMMDEARNGRAIDRHLFGLWCAAYEQNRDIPELYDDELYTKSGGGGNFVLSTSTLGFSANVGFVAPMVFNGYGVFYSITNENIFINTTAYRDSPLTSARKFNDAFKQILRRIRTLLLEAQESKL